MFRFKTFYYRTKSKMKCKSKCFIFNKFGFKIFDIRLFKSPFVLRSAILSDSKNIINHKAILLIWLKKHIKNIEKGEVGFATQSADYGNGKSTIIIYREYES